MPCKFDAAPTTARTLATAGVDAYESAARVVSELQWALGRGGLVEPFSSLSAACADLTRDTAAVVLSTMRWLLDL
jgi:hypothetical protein